MVVTLVQKIQEPDSFQKNIRKAMDIKLLTAPETFKDLIPKPSEVVITHDLSICKLPTASDAFKNVVPKPSES